MEMSIILYSSRFVSLVDINVATIAETVVTVADKKYKHLITWLL